MKDAIAAVYWKEVKDLSRQPGVFFGLLLMIPLMLVFLLALRVDPYEQGGGFVMWVLPMAASAVALAPDAFAGERERKTLETLLATPLPDRAILVGKVAAILTPGTLVALAMYALRSLVIPFTDVEVAPDAPFPAMAFLLAFSMGLILASVGVLLSLRVSTVRQAQQVLGVGMMILMLIPQLVLMVEPGLAAPLMRAILEGRLTMTHFALAALGLGLLLFALCGVAYRRERLMAG